MKREIVDARDAETHEHLCKVFSATKAEVMRLCTYMSQNDVRWFHDNWKWDWSAVDKHGKPCKVPRESNRACE